MSSFWDTPTTPSAPTAPVGGEPSIGNMPMPSFGVANSTPIFGASVASKIPSTIPGGKATPTTSFWDTPVAPASSVATEKTAPVFNPQPYQGSTSGQTISATPETLGSKIFGALPSGVQDTANWFNEKITGKSAIPQAPDLPSGLLKDNPLVPFLTSSPETRANKLQQELIDRGVDPKRAADVAMYDTYQRPGQNQPLQRGQADQKIALTPDEKSAISWRGLMNVGGLALDVGGVLPIGSISKTATIAEDIARSTDANHIVSVLQKEIPNITPDVAQASANALRDINDAKSVETVLNRLNYKFNAPKAPVAETGGFWDTPKAELPAPLTEGQSSTIGTTLSAERAAQKSADYTARQSTFAPISEADNTAIKARIAGLGKTPTTETQSPLATEARKYKTAEEFVNAQGTPVYHGTKADIKSISELDSLTYGDPQALYGPGVYLTDSPKIAKGYSKTKGMGIETGKVLVGEIDKNTKLLNLENILTPEEAKVFNDYINLEIGDLMAGTDDATGITGKLAFKKVQETLSDAGIPKYEANDIILELQQTLAEKFGYKGFSHIGGIQGGEKHGVSILFNYGEPGYKLPIKDVENFKTKSQLTDIWNKAQNVKAPSLGKLLSKKVNPETELAKANALQTKIEEARTMGRTLQEQKAVEARAKVRKEVAPVKKSQGTLDGINPTQATKLTPEDSAPLAQKASDQYYRDVIEPAQKRGEPTIIGADDFKDHFGKDYNDNNHPVYSRAAFLSYERALKDVKNPTVVLTGGGPSSGKTELLINNIKKSGFDGVVYDSNMANYDGVVKQIELAKESGKQVEIYGIIPNLDRARTFSILRENRIGRGISDATFARGHAGFPNVASKLIENGKLPESNVHVFDMRHAPDLEGAMTQIVGKGRVGSPLAFINKLGYNEEELKTLYGKTNYEQTTGRRVQELRLSKVSGETPGGHRPDQGEVVGQTDRGGVQQGTKGLGKLTQTTKKPVSEIDRLIAQGKIRVVSRDGSDVYQTKKGSEWVNARNEDSAIAKVTKVPEKKAQAELPQSIEEEKLRLEMKKEVLDSNPAKGLGKLVTKRGEFAGGLTEAGGKGAGKWAKEGDQIASDLGFADSEEARVAYADYQAELATLKDQQSSLKDQIKEYKIQQATEARITREKGLAPVRESAKVELPQVQGTGEARTLERTAQEQLSREGQGDSPDIWPLDKMIVSLPGTPLKAKVNMLDYIRTPDKVLQKIGLAKEAEVMRVGYEGYLKELPKNIDKITAWSKEVPKAANERIFKWLDGQAIDLAPNELKVGEEIKTWLSEWADRLGMPKDDRIANYITHIFDDQLIKKEFDEDLAKIIADKIPGTVYNPFLQKRLGAQGYKQDTWAALDAYVKRATRKVHMDPALNVLEDAAGGLEKSQWDYVKNYVDRVNMRPTDIDNLLDNGVKQIIGYRFGQRPTLAVTRVLRQATYRGMLGLNVGSALRNLSQGMNTYAKLGERYTALGYMNLMKSGAKEELEHEGVLAESFIQDRAISSTKKAVEKVDKALFYMFQTVEHINRGSAYFGAKAMALNSGKTEEQAIIFAKKIVRDTQFVFGSIDTPLILSSDIAKTLGQFQTFTTKQIEFLAEMAKNKEYAGLLRYVIGGLAFTYTLGQAFGMSPSDLIPMYRIGTPPSLKFPVELTKAVVNAPDQYGRQKTVPQKVKSVTDTLWGYIPGGIQIKKTIEGSQAVSAGGVQNKLGRLQFKTDDTLSAKAQAVTFGKYASPQAQDYFAGISRAERLDMELQKLSPAEANAKFAEATKNDPALADQLRKVVEDRKLGLTPEEKQIRSMGVLDGSRAKFIDDQLSGLKTREEKNARYQELVTKKIITDKVAVQIQALIAKKSSGTYVPQRTSTTQEAPLATESNVQATKDAVYKAFPFSAQAHDIINKAKIGVLGAGDKTNTELFNGATALGEMRGKGTDFNNFVVKHIAPFSKGISDFILNHTSFLQNLDQANIDIKTTDPTTLAHEMLHQVFDNSPLSDNKLYPNDPKNVEAMGNYFLNTWDKVAQTNQDSPLAMIDEHLNSDYKTQDMSGSELATERFAYLGELVGKYGVSVIPKELRPYYQDVFDFSRNKNQ